MYALLGTRDNSARIVPLATREIQRDWGLLAPVFPVTAKGAGPAIQTQVSEPKPGPGVWGAGESQLSGSPVEPRAGEEIPHPNSLRRWEKNGTHGAEVKGDGRGHSTLDPFRYGNATALREKGARLQEMTVMFRARWELVLSCKHYVGRSKASQGLTGVPANGMTVKDRGTVLCYGSGGSVCLRHVRGKGETQGGGHVYIWFMGGDECQWSDAGGSFGKTWGSGV